jgi:HD superfamily phosphohydrolase
MLGTHEELGASLIQKGPIADAIGENYSPKKIAALAMGEGLGQIIASDIGSDRMDYLIRDSHYTGVAYGVIDKDRILQTAKLHARKLLVCEGGLEALESLLIARFLMFSTVYYHHTVRIATVMLQAALRDALKAGAIGKPELLSMGDEEMLSKLCAIPASSSLATSIRDRRLYKRAFEMTVSDLGKIPKNLQEQITDAAGCPVLVDIPYRFWRTPEISVLRDSGELERIDHASELVKSLSLAQHSRIRLIVACEKKNMAKVAAAARKIL